MQSGGIWTKKRVFACVQRYVSVCDVWCGGVSDCFPFTDLAYEVPDPKGGRVELEASPEARADERELADVDLWGRERIRERRGVRAGGVGVSVHVSE